MAYKKTKAINIYFTINDQPQYKSRSFQLPTELTMSLYSGDLIAEGVAWPTILKLIDEDKPLPIPWVCEYANICSCFIYFM